MRRTMRRQAHNRRIRSIGPAWSHEVPPAMLYTFKSQAAANLIMLQANAERVLDIIGKDNAPKGILLPEHMASAITALEAAMAREDAALQVAIQAARAKGQVAPRADAVSLRQRALPFIDMLKRCHKAGKEVVWGV